MLRCMSELPELPTQIKHQEAAFGLLFREWMRTNRGKFGPACSFELKHTRGESSLPFDALVTEQVAYASKIEGNGALVRVDGQRGEPDYLWISRSPAYIVVRFPSFWCIIRARDFIWERNMGKRVSLTMERAREIAFIVV